MAGKRRETGKPMRRTIQPNARVQRLNGALAATDDPRARVAIALDHYRAALAAHPDPTDAERVVAFLVGAGNRLFKQREVERHDGNTE